MKLILIPPMKRPPPLPNLGFIMQEIVAGLRKKGQLDGVEVDIDEGYPTEYSSEFLNAGVFVETSLGVVKKVKEYSEMGKYDAIVITGGVDPGFVGARTVSKIPVTGALHSAAHVASLIGERFSIIFNVVANAVVCRRCVEGYGLGHKLASVRIIGHTALSILRLQSQYKKEERGKVPELRKIKDDMTAQCIAAIEKDRADALIFSCEPLEMFEDEVRKSLDEAGYNEIPIIDSTSAAVEMAKAMVKMGLVQAHRAYPTSALRAKPEYY